MQSALKKFKIEANSPEGLREPKGKSRDERIAAFAKEDFDQALKEVRSSVAKKDISRLESWEKENVQDAI